MIKMLIVDDHPIFRRGLKDLLEDSFGVIKIDEASDGSEALRLAEMNHYDVTLLDISMPGRGGLEIIKEIKKANSSTSVLMVSAYPEEQYAIRAIKSGALGYITKKSVGEELVGAVKSALKGESYISASIAQKMAFEIRGDSEKPPHEKLSNREYEVMCMIASGDTVSKIAEKLCLSVKTISTYRSQMLNKMNMKNNSEITHYSIKNNLVE